MNIEYYRKVSLAPYPALRLAIILCIGIWFGSYYESIATPYWFTAVGAFLVSWFVMYKISRRSLFKAITVTEQSLYLLLIITFGAFWYSLHLDFQQEEAPEQILTYSEDPMTAWGTIRRYRITDNGGVSFELEVDSVKTPQQNIWRTPFTTSGFIAQSQVNKPFIFGDYVTFLGHFDEIRAPRNPSEFDFKSIMTRRGIHINYWVDEILFVGEDRNKLGWNYWRSYTRSLLRNIYSEENEPLARAIILGDRSGLERDDQLAYSRAGLAHLMAVSGMHVGFLLFPIWFLLPYLWDKKWKQWSGLVGVFLLLYIYAGITGFTVSVLRASVMAMLLFYAKTFRISGNSLNYLGVAGLVVLLFSPMQLFEIGFQLSFVAVGVILLMLPVLRQSLPFKYRYTKVGGVYQLVMVSVIVQAGLYPLLVYYFGEFSLIGPLANTFAAFLVQVAFSWTLITLFIGIPFPGLATIINTPVDLFFGYFHSSVISIAELDFAWITVSISSSLIFLIWASAIFMLASLKNPFIRWKALNVFLLLLCFYQAEKIWDKFDPGELEIVVFDVGQGDAVLIQSPDGTTAMYDTGVWSPYRNSGESVIVPELQARGIDHLHAVILSHPHADHIGGIIEIMHAVEIDTIYDAGFEYDSAIYQNFLKTADELNIPVKEPVLGDIIWIGNQIPFFVMSPHDLLSGNDPNTYSIVGKMYYGETSTLLTGDATSQTEKYLVENFQTFLDSDLLKVAHHGSYTSSTEKFLKASAPEISVTSLGFHNRYRHPHREAVTRLEAHVENNSYTSLDGAIIFRSDGEKIRRHYWR